MSTATTPPPIPTAQPTLDVSGTQTVPFGRLVGVEWRKMIDTRSGFWLLLVTGFLLLLTGGLTILVVALNDLSVTANALSQIYTIPVSLLLPVFGVLIITSEWSQRTALASFTLEPHRLKVMGAKVAAVTAFALTTMLVALVLGALTNVICASITGDDVVWNLAGGELFWLFLNQLLYFLMGVGFGMLLLNTPGAVSLYYVVALLLPFMVYSTLFALFDWAQDVLPWVDMGIAIAPLSSGSDFNGNPVGTDLTNYAQVAFTALLWVGLPIVVGLARVRRAELK